MQKLDVVPNFVDGKFPSSQPGELGRYEKVTELLGSLRDVVKHCLDSQGAGRVHLLDVSDTTIHSYLGGETLAHVTMGLSAPWGGKNSLSSESYERFWDALTEAGMTPKISTANVQVERWGRTICTISVDRAQAEEFLKR
jgi:hypothetical protein